MTQLGTGLFSYMVAQDWGQLPQGMHVGDVAGIAVDGNDNVYLLNRGDHPMIVLDRRGSILRTWGEGIFTRPHGVHIGHDGCVYCTDDGDHLPEVAGEGLPLVTLHAMVSCRLHIRGGIGYCYENRH
jgi:hypothetical protein